MPGSDQTSGAPGRPSGAPVARATMFVSGHVQGVGFRWWTRSRALELGLTGLARNLTDGRVEVVAEGPREALERLESLLQEFPSTMRRPGRVTAVTTQWSTPRGGLAGFVDA